MILNGMATALLGVCDLISFLPGLPVGGCGLLSMIAAVFVIQHGRSVVQARAADGTRAPSLAP